MNSLIASLINFLEKIELKAVVGTIDEPTFLPGLKINRGTLLIDLEKLKYPGDILHEGGHLATMPPHIRSQMDSDLENNDLHRGGELMALAWSYAACIELKIEPSVVFHKDGYKGDSAQLIESFKQGFAPGLPMLQWCGMSYDEATAKQLNKQPFPHMESWTCISRPQ